MNNKHTGYIYTYKPYVPSCPSNSQNPKPLNPKPENPNPNPNPNPPQSPEP